MRSLLLTPLFRSIRTIEGVGPKIAVHMARLIGGERVLDLLLHMPVDIIDRRYRPSIAESINGRTATMRLTVRKHIPNARKSQPYRIKAFDESGQIDLVFFHARKPYLTEHYPEGAVVTICGRVDHGYGGAQMVHPDLLQSGRVAPESDTDKETDIIETDIEWVEPLYPMTQGLSPRSFRKAMLQALTQIPTLPDWIDGGYLAKQNWPSWPEALKTLHRPDKAAQISPDSPARQRLAFDEFLAQQLAMRLIRRSLKRPVGQVFTPNFTLRKAVLSQFGHPLTGAQQQALKDIDADMQSRAKMLRLLQGDVGSGKTIVALCAATNAIECGHQAAIMAPTEILARQHYDTIAPLAQAAGISCTILTGRDKGKKRQAILDDIAGGHARLIIGTHALFQDQVIFEKLGLAVIDEQHRFGVQQRLALSGKGAQADILVMTATPIPRSLTLAAYGDMDVSRLNEKPPGRKPIDTRLISIDRLADVVEALRRKIHQGERIYWVCPLVEESEKLDLAAAEERYTLLRQIFGERIGLVHGRMKGAEKDAVMERFAGGDLDILIATTVIEVGVNVPEATVMVIEHAERFGLSQLHQLRGRVGRGDKASSCLLLYSAKLGAVAKERLGVMRDTEDGFLIAEKDLEIRGSGDLLGTAQSGLPRYRTASLEDHQDLLFSARQYADYVLNRDETLDTAQGEALRMLLYLYEKDKAIEYLRSG